MVSDYREKVFEIIDKVRAMYPYRIPGRSDTYDSYNEAWKDCANQIEAEIEALPYEDVPDKNVGEWISCSERLPEKKTSVLISTKNYVREGYYCETTEEHVIWKDSRFGSTYWDDEVIAWIPLPEPYKEGGEQE